MVRRKVINLLALILSHSSSIKEDDNKTTVVILRVLLLKWQDSNETVRSNLVKCLGTLFTQRLLSNPTTSIKSNSTKDIQADGVKSALSFLKQLLMCLPIPQPYDYEDSDSYSFDDRQVWTQVFGTNDIRASIESCSTELSYCIVKDVISAI